MCLVLNKCDRKIDGNVVIATFDIVELEAVIKLYFL